jgi:hypothetical protein
LKNSWHGLLGREIIGKTRGQDAHATFFNGQLTAYMDQSLYESPRESTAKRKQPPIERLTAFPGWGRIALLVLIVSLLTALFLIAFLFTLMDAPL